MFKQGYQHVRGRLENETENVFYERTYYCLKGFEKRVLVPDGMLWGRAKEIVRYVFEENPSFFHFSPYNICFIENTHGRFIDFCYQYDKAEYNKCEMMIKKQVSDFIRKSQILRLDPYNRIVLLFNLILNMGIYNSETKQSKKHGSIEDYNIVGLFRNHKAVCYGFAQAFKLMCDEVGLRCMIIRGELCDNANEPHAWNLVEYNHNFYHVDTTMSLQKKDMLHRYQFFMINSNWISKTRIIDPKIPLPQIGGLECTMYFRNGFHFNTEKEINAYFRKMLNSHKREILLQVDNISSAKIQTCFTESLLKLRAGNNNGSDIDYTFIALDDYGLFCFKMNAI